MSAVMATVAGLETRLAGTDAVSRAVLTNVVVRAIPFHCTTAPVAKPPPLTVSGNAESPPIPTATGFGLKVAMVGTVAWDSL